MGTSPSKPQIFTISLIDTGKAFRCDNQSDLISAHNRSGLDGISNRCRRGGCGLCKVKIIAGTYTTEAMNRGYISPTELQQNIVLACRVIPTSNLQIEQLPGRAAFAITAPAKTSH